MSKTKIIKPYEYAMTMIMQIYLMPSTGDYDTVKSTPSDMDDPSAHVLECKSYLLSISVVFTLKYILRRSIFVSFGIEERINGSLNVVDFAIL